MTGRKIPACDGMAGGEMPTPLEHSETDSNGMTEGMIMIPNDKHAESNAAEKTNGP